MIEIILQFQLFGQAQIMTLGGPNNASLPIVLFIYQIGFQRWDIGYAAAASEILFCIILVAAMTQFFAVARTREAMSMARQDPVCATLCRLAALGDRGAGDGGAAAVDAASVAETERRTAARHADGVLPALHTAELHGHPRPLRGLRLALEQRDRLASASRFGVLALSSLAGYGFARLRFPGRDVIFVIVLFGLAIPEQSVIIARHQMFSALDCTTPMAGLIFPGLAAPFGVFLMTQYFRAMPKELEEAAWLDGASRFRTFWRILLPLSLPAQATLGIFTFLSTWNDYWWPLISATNSEMYTLTVGVASSQMNFAQTNGLGLSDGAGGLCQRADPDRLRDLPALHRGRRSRAAA